MITFATLAGTVSYEETGFILSSPNRVWTKSNPNTLSTVVDLLHAGNLAPGTISAARGDGGAFSFAGVELSAGPVAGEILKKPTFKYSIVGTLKGKQVVKLTGELKSIPVAGQQQWNPVNQNPTKTVDALSISISTVQCSASKVGYAVRNLNVTAA